MHAALTSFGIPAVLVDTQDEDWQHRLPKETVAFIAMHGPGGEDGTIQGYLDSLCIPYTGTGVLGSAVAMNKVTCKQIAASLGIPTPKWATTAQQAVEQLTPPLLSKPITGGGSIGIKLLETLTELPFIQNAFSQTFYEVFTKGRSVTQSIAFIDRSIVVLPTVEIVLPAGKRMYDEQLKYQGGASFVTPAKLSPHIAESIKSACELLIVSLDLRDFARFDFVVTEECAWFLELNTIPGFYNGSNFELALRTDGLDISKVFILTLANALLRQERSKVC